MKDYRNMFRIFLQASLCAIFVLVYLQDNYGQNSNTDNDSFSEELHIVTDRDIYFAGEEVYLKIYKFNRHTHTPENISKVVYLDIFDNYNNPLIQVKTGIDGYSGSAWFRLPDTIPTGNYLIRAYTGWMKNFSGDLFSARRISVINPFENIKNLRVPVNETLPDTVLFFPETGSIVTGVDNRIGIECLANSGDPVRVSGVVINSSNDTVCHIQTDNSGTGFFTIRPAQSQDMFFVTRVKDGPDKRFILPPATNSGITFSVEDNRAAGQINLFIRKSPGTTIINQVLNLVYSPASMKPFTRYIYPVIDSVISLRHKDLPAGLAKVTITDTDGKILASRWVWNDVTEEIKITLNINSRSPSARGKVKIGINTSDLNGNPVESDLTISVVKSFTTDDSPYREMTRSIGLPSTESFTTGQIFPEINDYLIFLPFSDALLNINSTDFIPEYYPETYGHSISGNLRNRLTGEPLKNEIISLSFVGKPALCRFTHTDEKGDFSFISREEGPREIVVQPVSRELKGCIVRINDPFILAHKRIYLPPFYLDTSRLDEINNAIIAIQVGNIYTRELNPQKADLNKPEEFDFYGDPDKTILLSDFIELTSLKEVIKEIVPGVTTNTTNDRRNFKMINRHPTGPFENSPMVILDGVPVNDIDIVLGIKPSEIERIEVVNTRYFISDLVIEGIINFKSLKGDLSAIEFDRSIFRREYTGLQPYRKFHLPDYSTDSLRRSRIPDFRNILFWEPELKTGKNGTAEAEFYTSDEPGEYSIIVEGVTRDGKTGHAKVSFRVDDSQ